MFSSWRLENQPSLLLEKCLPRNRPACEIIVDVIEIRLTFIADWRTVIQVQVDCNWIIEVRYVQRFGYGVTDSGERWKGSGKGEGCYNGRSETGVIKEGKMEVQGCKDFRLLCYYEDKSSCLEVLSRSGKPGPHALQCSCLHCLQGSWGSRSLTWEQNTWRWCSWCTLCPICSPGAERSVCGCMTATSGPCKLPMSRLLLSFWVSMFP